MQVLCLAKGSVANPTRPLAGAEDAQVDNARIIYILHTYLLLITHRNILKCIFFAKVQIFFQTTKYIKC